MTSPSGTVCSTIVTTAQHLSRTIDNNIVPTLIGLGSQVLCTHIESQECVSHLEIVIDNFKIGI